MESKRLETTLGQTCHITDGAHSKVKRQKKGILYLTSKNIGKGNLILDKIDFISNEDYEKLFSINSKSKRRPTDGDVLTGIIGTFGNVYKYTSNDKFGISSSVAILRPNKNILNSDFLYYTITSPKFKLIIEAYKSGSVQGYTNIPTLKQLPITLLPLPEQKAIAQILSSLDDKIELNRQMNQTLEQMAQAMFKSWFVDFDPVFDNAIATGKAIPEELQAKAKKRKAIANKKPLPKEIQELFPNEFELTEEMGWIPKGWVNKPLSEITSELRRGISPKYIEEGGIPVINQKCIRNHSINFSLARKNNPELKKVEGRFLEKGDVLINSTGTGTLGRIAQFSSYNEPIVVDSHVTVVRPEHTEYLPYTFGRMMFSIESFIEAMGEGSTGQTELSRVNLSKIKVLVPPFGIQQYTEHNFKNIANKISFNLIAINKLTQVRDTLLPNLISGELRVPEVLIEKE